MDQIVCEERQKKAAKDQQLLTEVFFALAADLNWASQRIDWFAELEKESKKRVKNPDVVIHEDLMMRLNESYAFSLVVLSDCCDAMSDLFYRLAKSPGLVSVSNRPDLYDASLDFAGRLTEHETSLMMKFRQEAFGRLFPDVTSAGTATEGALRNLGKIMSKTGRKISRHRNQIVHRLKERVRAKRSERNNCVVASYEEITGFLKHAQSQMADLYLLVTGNNFPFSSHSSAVEDIVDLLKCGSITNIFMLTEVSLDLKRYGEKDVTYVSRRTRICVRDD